MEYKLAYALWAAAASTIALVAITAWMNDRAKRTYLLWSSAFLSTAIGIVSISLRGQIPDFLSIELGNAFVISGLSIWLAGTMIFDGRKPRFWIFAPVAIWISGMLIPFVRDDFVMRVSVFNIAVACGYLFIALMILSENTGQRRILRRLLAIAFIMQFAGTVALAVAVQILRPADLSQYSLGLISISGALFVLVATVMFGTSLVVSHATDTLNDLADRDPLTNTHNRRGLLKAFERARTLHGNGNGLVALLVLDMDHFKTINDQFGHPVGDDVLCRFAEMVASHIRPHDLLGRIGGEEFVAILQDIHAVEAHRIAETIRKTLAEAQFLYGTERLHVTVSVGMVVSSWERADFKKLYMLADRELYNAKSNGRNQVSICYARDVKDETKLVRLVKS